MRKAEKKTQRTHVELVQTVEGEMKKKVAAKINTRSGATIVAVAGAAQCVHRGRWGVGGAMTSSRQRCACGKRRNAGVLFRDVITLGQYEALETSVLDEAAFM